MRGAISGTELIRLFLVALLAAILALAGSWLIREFSGDSPLSGDTITSAYAPPPGREFIDNFTCEEGLSRIVLMRGVEDSFSLEGDEPAVIRPKLLDNGHYRSLSGQENFPDIRRNYDEAGLDRHLVDHFTVPRGIVSGKFLFSARQLNDLPNDAVVLGDFDESSRAQLPYGAINFYAPVGMSAEATDHPQALLTGFFVIDLSEMLRTDHSSFDGDMIDFLNSAERPDEVDFSINEDTQVDFAALLLCQEPEAGRGTTFREFRNKPYGDDISIFTCQTDMTAPACNPDSGDQLCSAPSPLACYREGGRELEQGIEDRFNHLSAFVGGEIRLTEPVIAESFATLDDANAYCGAQFGAGWRVLSFHEAGGHRTASYSRIPAGSRGLVHVGDRPYGNCWDRPESVRDGG